MPKTDAAPEPPFAVVTYRGENGPGWVPKSKRDLWNYAVHTMQIVVPPALDDGGLVDMVLEPGQLFGITWVPPEYDGRLTKAEPPPQPAYFTLEDQ